jgi:sugar/nucleoside kinase (ribokinase family)
MGKDRTDLVVTVLGDLNAELVSRLDEFNFLELDRDALLYHPIALRTGGTAASFAKAALAYFREVHVLGKVGADPLGAMICDELTRLGIGVHCDSDPRAPTGLDIALRDANPARVRGTRLVVVRTHSANHQLAIADVERHAATLAGSDALVLDGYCFLEPPRRDASMHAMRIADAAGVTIAFDIVPHTAYTLYDLATLQSMVELADIIIVEVRTIRRFLGLEVPEGIIDAAMALATADALRTEFPAFKDKTSFLRFGIDNADQSLICLPNAAPQQTFTGYSQAQDLYGFGDRLTVRELAVTVPLLREGKHRPVRRLDLGGMHRDP